MWILKYEYDLDNGTTKHISSCLLRSVTYSIGRSSKNPLCIKNDKSISRQHVQFKWGVDGDITIKNEGKLTVIQDKYLKTEETIDFKVTTDFKEILIKLGTKPVVVSVAWKSLMVDIPRGYEEFSSQLYNLGIDVRNNLEDIPRVDVLLQSDYNQLNSYRELYGLLNESCLVMKIDIFQELCDTLSVKDIDFDLKWSKIFDNDNFKEFSNNIINYKSIKGIFKDVDFILLSEINLQNIKFVELSVNILGGYFINFTDIGEFKEYLQNINSSPIVVIIEANDTDVKIDNLITKIYKIDDVVKSIIMGSTKDIMSALEIHKPKELSRRLEDDVDIKTDDVECEMTTQTLLNESRHLEPLIDPSPLPVKRRRLNRPKVKPLNSLSFFAGGNTLAEDNKIPQSEIILPMEIKSLNDTDNTDNKSEMIKSPHNISIRHSQDIIPATQINNIESICDSSSNELNEIDRSVPPTTTQDNEFRSIAEKINEKLSNKKTEKSRSNTLREPIHDSSENSPNLTVPSSLIEAIQSTKMREVERLKTNIVEVLSTELTETAINEFSNLQIDVNPNLLVRTDSYRKMNDSNPEWQGHKNFKKFVKVWPKSHACNDSNKNSAFLITREYVDLIQYDKNAKKTNTHLHNHNLGEDIDHGSKLNEDERLLVEMHKRQVLVDEANKENDDEYLFTFSRTQPKGNGLFVDDDDEDDEQGQLAMFGEQLIPALELPSTKRQKLDNYNVVGEQSPYSVVSKFRATESTAIDDDDSSDDDYDGPKFKFRRKQ